MRTRQLLAAVFLLVLGSQPAVNAAPILGSDFVGSYTVNNLGNVPGLPANYGGLTTLYGDPNTLLIGGGANGAAGRLYTIGVTRDGDGHITGFTGSASAYGNVGEYNDGGVVDGPGGVLFTARWPVNGIGQTRLGEFDEHRIDTVAGIESSVSAMNFVPAGFGGAGSLKVVTYSGGAFYDVAMTPDGTGTFDLSATFVTRLGGGPEGFVYVAAGNPGFTVNSMLVSEYGAGMVGAYEVDALGNPIVASRRNFLTGLSGAEGAFIDPLTGDFLFSTFGSGNEVFRVSGFRAPEPPSQVPEPASLALFGLGALGVGIGVRRRRAA